MLAPTHVLFAPKNAPQLEQAKRLLAESNLKFFVQEWSDDDPERAEHLTLVTSLGDFVGLEGMRYYVQDYQTLCRRLTTVAIREKFEKLAREWDDQCKYKASVKDMVQTPACQQILRIGESAIPLILSRLMQDEKPRWCWALAEITRQNPVPEEARGNVSAMIDAWIRWGVENDYLS